MIEITLPSDWVWTKLGEITEVIRGASPRPKGDPKYFGGNIPWIMISDISKERGKYISKTKDTVTEEGARKSRYLNAGTLILSNSGTVCVPKILAVNGCIHDGFVAFPNISNEIIHILYLYYYFEYIRPQVIQENKQGVTQINLNTSIVKDLLIPFPPLPEQRRIVARIEELFSRLDAGVEALQRAKAQLRRYRQAVLKAAVEGRLTEEWRKAHPEVEPAEKLLERISKERRCFWENRELAKMSVKGERQKKNRYKEPEVLNSIDLPELPEIWDWATLEQLSACERNSITDGPFGSNLKTSHYTSNGPRVIRLQNIGKGEFRDEKAHISEDHFKKLKKHAVYPGDIVIAALGNPAPRACLIPKWIGDAIVKADCIRLKVIEGKISTRYVMYSLNSFPTQKRTEEVIHGVGRPRLNLGEIKNIVIPLPPIEEQKIIAEEIERSLSIADKVNDTIEFNMKRSELLRQSILKRAFGGRLVPQDHGEEPASMLLERIEAERAKAAPKRGRKNSSNSARQMRITQ